MSQCEKCSWHTPVKDNDPRLNTLKKQDKSIVLRNGKCERQELIDAFGPLIAPALGYQKRYKKNSRTNYSYQISTDGTCDWFREEVILD